MENSVPSLKIFRTKFSTSALYNGRNKNRRQNPVWQFTKTIIPFALVGYEVIITNSGSWNNCYIDYMILCRLDPTFTYSILSARSNPNFRSLEGSAIRKENAGTEKLVGFESTTSWLDHWWSIPTELQDQTVAYMGYWPSVRSRWLDIGPRRSRGP